MEDLIVGFFVVLVLSYITIYITKGEGLWNNVEIYTPDWGHEYTIFLFLYLFVILLTIHYYKTRDSKALFISILILYAFVVFCLADGIDSYQESFILATIVLFLLFVNIGMTFILRGNKEKLLAVLPLIIYLYLYVWVYEINNNY